MEGLFSEHIATSNGFRGDLDGAETARISMKELHKLAVIISCASLAQDVVVKLRQHDAASGGNSKDLISKNPSFVKADADTVMTKKDASEIADITFDELNSVNGIGVAEILSEDLDVNNGFAYVSVQLTTSGARVGSATYHSVMPRLKPAYLTEL